MPRALSLELLAANVGSLREAKGGTLFLDEIDELDMAFQAQLLRILQERKIKAVNVHKDIKVRMIAATHKDLFAAIKEGRFREDLYHRLAVIPIHIPPLRHRKEDIPVLARFFLQKRNMALPTILQSKALPV